MHPALKIVIRESSTHFEYYTVVGKSLVDQHWTNLCHPPESLAGIPLFWQHGGWN